MGKVQQFFVQLDKANAVYFAGDWITGQVVVNLADNTKMRGIHIAFKGEAYVHWTEEKTREERVGERMERRTETVHYTAREPYFNDSAVLFGKPFGQMSGSNPVLGRGQHVLPFQFRLPYDVPSSYESKFGHIRYMLRATIDMPWQFDHVTKRPFTVVALVDLNNIPNARHSQESEDDKMICCLCCASGPISARLKLDRSGYVPGEYITMSGEVDNRSRRKVKNIRLKLDVRTTFYAQGKSKTTWKTISEIRRSGIGKEERDCFNGLSLHIPPLPPSYLGGCRIINITYVLKLAVSPSGPSIALDVPLEVIIGTIPLRNVNLYFGQNPYQPILYDQNAWMNAPPALPSAPPGDAMPVLPPPAYEECFWGRTAIVDEDDTEHTTGTREWAPAYPYYAWGNDPSAPPLPNNSNSAPPPGPPGGNTYMPPGGAGYVQNQPPAGALQAPPPHGPPAGAGYGPPGAFPAGAAPFPEQPPAYAPPVGYAPPPAGYAQAPPGGFAGPPPGQPGQYEAHGLPPKV